MKSAAKSPFGGGALPPQLRKQTLEAPHQRYVVQWLRARKVLFTAPCNGHLQTARQRASAYKSGMENGVPDLLIFEPRHGKAGLAIEMKRPPPKPFTVSAEQHAFHRRLRAANWEVHVCRGAGEALDVLRWWLDAPVIEYKTDVQRFHDSGAESI